MGYCKCYAPKKGAFSYIWWCYMCSNCDRYWDEKHATKVAFYRQMAYLLLVAVGAAMTAAYLRIFVLSQLAYLLLAALGALAVGMAAYLRKYCKCGAPNKGSYSCIWRCDMCSNCGCCWDEKHAANVAASNFLSQMAYLLLGVGVGITGAAYLRSNCGSYCDEKHATNDSKTKDSASSKATNDNRANQLNPNNPLHKNRPEQIVNKNRSKQKNPNNFRYPDHLANNNRSVDDGYDEE
jgi:hypothetical protein